MPTQTDTDKLPRRHNDRLQFTIETPTTYQGDKYIWRIIARQGRRVVNVWDSTYDSGDHHTGYRTEPEARALAEAKLAWLKDCQLFVVSVNKWAISVGEDRSCSTCAIAQALWKMQKRDWKVYPDDFSFRVSPYGAFTTPEGLVYYANRGRGRMRIPPEKMPDIIVNYTRNGVHKWHAEHMAEWARDFDDWKESSYMTKAEWCSQTGEDYKPTKPSPGFFVLNMDEFTISEKFEIFDTPVNYIGNALADDDDE